MLMVQEFVEKLKSFREVVLPSLEDLICLHQNILAALCENPESIADVFEQQVGKDSILDILIHSRSLNLTPTNPTSICMKASPRAFEIIYPIL